MTKLTHLNAQGELNMVDVSAKPVLQREATAQGEIRLQKQTLNLIELQRIAKGNVLAAARLAIFVVVAEDILLRFCLLYFGPIARLRLLRGNHVQHN